MMMRVTGPDGLMTISVVMAGLEPAIHELMAALKDVDARHKAGHDEDCEFAP
jgi:hypothetical protein